MGHAIVIGAGVVGSSVAYRLTQGGMSVSIFERGYVGGGTSSATFGWINANNKPPREYHELNVAGMRAHMALRAEFGAAPWLQDTGNLEWVFDEQSREAQRKKVETLRAWGYAAEWVTLAELRAMEPDIDPASVGDAPIALYPDEGWIDPVRYAHAMIEGARRGGATLRIGTRVTHVDGSRGRVTGVRTAEGDTVGADVVVNCAGQWLNDVVDPGLRVPLAPTHGVLVLSAPVPTRLQRIVHAPQCHLRPDGASRLMIHDHGVDHHVTTDSTPAQALEAAHAGVRSAARILPGLTGARAEAVRVGTRPIPADGYPAIGALPGVEGYYVVVTHSAVTLAPLLGIIVADEVARGRADPRLAQFRPGRFAAKGVKAT
jgi:glycine/D-amino acid oxidase-like deaminating enzyme